MLTQPFPARAPCQAYAAHGKSAECRETLNDHLDVRTFLKKHFYTRSVLFHFAMFMSGDIIPIP